MGLSILCSGMQLQRFNCYFEQSSVNSLDSPPSTSDNIQNAYALNYIPGVRCDPLGALKVSAHFLQVALVVDSSIYSDSVTGRHCDGPHEPNNRKPEARHIFFSFGFLVIDLLLFYSSDID